MKSLQEVWSNVGQETKDLKFNYYATLLEIGVHGRIRLIVSEEDIDKEFGNSFRRLFMPDEKNVKVRVTVKIRYKDSDIEDKQSKYLIFIDNVETNGDIFSVELRKANGQIPGKNIYFKKKYEDIYVKNFNAGDIKSWSDILKLFEI